MVPQFPKTNESGVVLSHYMRCKVVMVKRYVHEPRLYLLPVPFMASALCSAKRAPIRSECLRNLSVQFITHCSSFDDSALLVKSLQHALKHQIGRAHV